MRLHLPAGVIDATASSKRSCRYELGIFLVEPEYGAGGGGGLVRDRRGGHGRCRRLLLRLSGFLAVRYRGIKRSLPDAGTLPDSRAVPYGFVFNVTWVRINDRAMNMGCISTRDVPEPLQRHHLHPLSQAAGRARVPVWAAARQHSDLSTRN